MQTRYTSSAESAWFNTPASGVADDTRAAGHISGWNAITKRVFRRTLVCAAITAELAVDPSTLTMWLKAGGFT